MSFKLLEAIKFATIKHKHQTRKNKSNDPYIVHPIEACQLLVSSGITDEDTLIAAVLHDVLEDTNTTCQEIEEKFGSRVLNIVLECTDDKTKSKIDRKKDQIEHVRTASLGGQLVKLADKLSNLSGLLNDPPSAWSQEEIKGYALWCMTVCEAVGSTGFQLQDKLYVIFRKFGLTDLPLKERQKQLEFYYNNIKNSE